MIKMIMSTSMIFMSFMMMFLNHPMSMGLFILLQTMMICLLSGMMIKTYWFSYILFLTFLGGLLVLFIYMASIASNEMFLMSNKMKILMIISILMITMLSLLIYNNLTWMNLSNNISENDNFIMIKTFNDDNLFNLNKMYNNHNFLMMMLMVIYLFIALVAIVKITNINYGPLRMN